MKRKEEIQCSTSAFINIEIRYQHHNLNRSWLIQHHLNEHTHTHNHTLTNASIHQNSRTCLSACAAHITRRPRKLRSIHISARRRVALRELWGRARKGIQIWTLDACVLLARISAASNGPVGSLLYFITEKAQMKDMLRQVTGYGYTKCMY